MDRVAADLPALLGTIECDRLAVVANRGLGRGIGGRARNADQPGSRGNIDDRPAALILHRPDRIAATEEGAVEIDPVHRAPIFQRGMFRVMRTNALLKTGHSRIVGEDICGRVQGGKPPPVRLLLEVQNECITVQFFASGDQRIGIEVG